MKKDDDIDQNMTVDIQIDDDTTVTCSIITIFSLCENDYIAVTPRDEHSQYYGEVWLYGYSENPDDPNEEPVLSYIEDDELYDAVEDAYDEFCDECEFNEMKD